LRGFIKEDLEGTRGEQTDREREERRKEKGQPTPELLRGISGGIIPLFDLQIV